MKRARPTDPRRAAEQRALRLGRWCRAALEVSAGVGYSAFLLVEAKLAARDPAAHGWTSWLAVAALIALPLFPATLDRLLAHAPRGGGSLVRVAWLVQALPLLLLDISEPAHLLLGPLALLQGNLLVRSGDARLAGWSLALGPVQVLAGMALAPAPEWLLLFPLSMLAALAALLLLLARDVEERVLERAPRLLLARGADPGRRVPREWAARLARAAPLTALVLFTTVPLYLAVSSARAPLSRIWNQGAAPREAAQRERERAAREEGPRGASTDDALRHMFPESLSYDSDGRRSTHRAVMEIAPRPLRSGRPRPRALYMRGLVLDRFGIDGADFGGGLAFRTVRAGDDGWCALETPPGDDLLQLDVLLEPLFIGDAWSNVLFTPQPVYAIDRPAVRHHPDDRLVVPIAPQEPIAYSVVVPHPDVTLPRTFRGSARHPDPRYSALPPGGESVAWITERARQTMRGAADDTERVRRVLALFRADYAYSLESPSLPGVEGVVDFMQRREGHCTSFSVAAVLLLRSSGIAARVATGYLASDWSEEDGVFRVTTRNGHAWIEVFFEGHGWRTLDPTPPERRAAALAAAEAGDQDESLRGWLRELRENAVFWSSTGGHDSYLRGFLATLLRGPLVLLRALGTRSGALALLVLAAVLWLVWRRSRSSRALVAGAPAPPRGELAGPHQRLLRALERRGFRRRPPETLREFAHATAEHGGEGYAPLVELVEVLYRARFGARPPSAGERAALDAFVRRIEQPLPRPEQV